MAVVAVMVGRVEAATLSLGEVSGFPGQSQLALPLSLAVASGEQINALYVDVHFDPAIALLGSVTLEPSVLALNKQVQIHPVAPGHLRLVVYGLDRQTLSSGLMGRCLISIAAATNETSSVVSLQDGLGVNADGQEQALGLTDGRVWIDSASDTVAPVISAIAISEIIAGQADVTWATDESAACRLEYGTTATYDTTATSGNGFITDHRVVVADILAATVYHYQVRCEDAAGNVGATGDRVFTVPAVTILSPADGSTLTGTSVSIAFSVTGAVIRSGSGYQHLHIKLDSGKVLHVYNTKPFPFTALKPGTHTVSVSLAENDTHTRVSGTSMASVTFSVK